MRGSAVSVVRPGAKCRVAKIEAGRRVSAAGQQPVATGFEATSTSPVKNNSGIGREPTKPH
jgi:hypothetical protein